MTASPINHARGGLAPKLAGSLYWRVFLLNGLVMVVAATALAVSPLTVSFPATDRQIAFLACGLILMLGANAVLLRMSLKPLRLLSQAMGEIDLLRPGSRLGVVGASELVSVAEAFNTMLARLESERRVSTSRVLDDQEQERKRLSTDLHDEVGQSLTGLLLMLQPAIDEAPPELVPTLESIQATLRATLDEVRRIARGLRPAALDDLGLVFALSALCQVTEDSTGAAVAREIDRDIPPLDEETELAVYRIAQEAMANVSRHSGATQVVVELTQRGGHLFLRVADNGRGMLYAPGVEAGGIRGIRERALAVGARVSIDSRPGGGTDVTTLIPVAQP